ncbi:hypothetical protein CIK99_01625 [Prevotella sp. P5-92]|uniref:hypothetical protein n=1 Tax=Prevotella sp. P5-92 TaxID=2024222 RepID=UPI000B97C673|nr:hypothetical protein [Prevotella sp. P5-92]OYP59641.1 hypothetical protein CIK99_01625 [Prevotella sp. P5-92]
MKLIYSLLSFLMGADFEILKLCPIDFAKQRKRVFIALIVALLSGISATFVFKKELSIGIAIVVALLYIVFLCKSMSASFSKFVTTLAVAAFIFWGISYPAYGGLNYLNVKNIESIVIAGIIAVVDLVLCYMPVNFSDENASYEKLIKQKIANKEAAAKLLVDEKANAERAIIRNREAARVKLEADVAKYMSDKILKSQKTVIDRIADKWVKGLEKEISSNIQNFCSYDKIQQIKINKVYEDELNNYISELLKDKREEFAKIIVDKWAEEKKQELSNNPNSYIS